MTAFAFVHAKRFSIMGRIVSALGLTMACVSIVCAVQTTRWPIRTGLLGNSGLLVYMYRATTTAEAGGFDYSSLDKDVDVVPIKLDDLTPSYEFSSEGGGETSQDEPSSGVELVDLSMYDAMSGMLSAVAAVLCMFSLQPVWDTPVTRAFRINEEET